MTTSLYAILIAQTGFSRDFTGVHTPQDVIVGFSESISLSIGYAEVHSASDPLNVEELVELADKALYEVKRSGKGEVQGL
ncbi:MAG: hypothetical protein IJ641_07135 [Lachnospiraceae bacterium]|nr:hypothetical protein [Lachnospiraceae bacterium]